MLTEESNKNITPTNSQAKAILALCQLLQLRDRYNDGDQLVMNGTIEYYIIHIGQLKPIKAKSCWINNILVFKTEELNHFLQHHRALIEEAKELL